MSAAASDSKGDYKIVVDQDQDPALASTRPASTFASPGALASRARLRLRSTLRSTTRHSPSCATARRASS